MGVPEEEEDVPDSYLCEECGSGDHPETLQAIARGEPIWETRNRIYLNEKKMSRNRKGKTGKAGWLKKDVEPAEEMNEGVAKPEEVVEETQETGSKRKRSEPKEEPQQQQEVKPESPTEEKKPTRGSTRQDKRRKSAPPADDPATALIPISQLPADRQKIAQALSKILGEAIATRVGSGAFRIPEGQSPPSLADHHASRIEYALLMNHESEKAVGYKDQFRTLFANLKANPLLTERLLQGSLTADELSTMNSADLASEALQKERAVMKEQLDRQAVAIEQQEGPRYRRTHKGDELIEDVEMHGTAETGGSGVAPVRERTSIADAEMMEAGSPTVNKVDGSADSPTTTKQRTETPLRVDTKRQESSVSLSRPSGHERRQSSQQFDMNSIWAKTAQSPTSASAPRPLQMPPRRRSSQPMQETSGTKDDADIDRMLQDDDEETYSPAGEDYTGEVVWRGKLVQSADSVSPTVNARFVAGRDLAATIPWRDLLPENLPIDGRLAIARAEEYLCSLQWSQSTDVSVLALTPYDDAEGFEAVFSYFKSRQRYGVVNKNKPAMVKDLYIIPLEQGEGLPDHVGLLEFCKLKAPVEERCLLASVVVSRAPEAAMTSQQQQAAEEAVQGQQMAPVNGHQLPQHMRAAATGPSGSPLNANSATFSPSNNGAFPPNPYAATAGMAPGPHPNPLINEILGTLQYAPTAQQIVAADPNISQEKLENLRQILEEDLNCRTDINALAQKLFARG